MEGSNDAREDARSTVMARQLRCIECGEVASDRARGWQVLLADDNEPTVYCPGCAEREFGTE